MREKKQIGLGGKKKSIGGQWWEHKRLMSDEEEGSFMEGR